MPYFCRWRRVYAIFLYTAESICHIFVYGGEYMPYFCIRRRVYAIFLWTAESICNLFVDGGEYMPSFCRRQRFTWTYVYSSFKVLISFRFEMTKPVLGYWDIRWIPLDFKHLQYSNISLLTLKYLYLVSWIWYRDFSNIWLTVRPKKVLWF